MKELFKKSVVPILSAVVGGAIVLAAVKLSPTGPSVKESKILKILKHTDLTEF